LTDCGSRSCRVLGRLASRTRQSEIVNLLILQTLARQGNVAEVFAGYGPVVVDECRHLPAVALERSVRAAISHRWVGLSAS
jgi:superfamily II DNA or RNA helicase